MPMGDGVRRNVAHISQEERNRLRDAFLELHHRFYPGNKDDIPAGGVSHWFKQDEIHQATHIHSFQGRGIVFLPWHRELCNRLEALLREVDPVLSLHYWDWNTDPRNSADGAGGSVNLFSPDFMGSASGPAGEPWLSAGFYDPNANPPRGEFEGDPSGSGNPVDPPKSLLRSVGAGVPARPWTDTEIIQVETFPEMRGRLENSHDVTHNYIGGTIGNPHTSFRDPFVFLLHSNVDRLFALWQLQSGKQWRLDPEQVYGTESNTDVIPGSAEYDPGMLTPLDPWAGNPNNNAHVHATRPWATPENEHLNPENRKNSKHPSVVAPPAYDSAQDAQFVAQQGPPRNVLPRERHAVSVTMRNVSGNTWTPEGTTPYRLGSQSPQDNTSWGLGRVELPHPVEPGSDVTFNFDITAPQTLGPYNFQWRMLEETVQWFGDFTPLIGVRVEPARCAELRSTIAQVERDIKDLWEEFKTAGPGRKTEIKSQVRELEEGLADLRAESTRLGCPP